MNLFSVKITEYRLFFGPKTWKQYKKVNFCMTFCMTFWQKTKNLEILRDFFISAITHFVNTVRSERMINLKVYFTFMWVSMIMEHDFGMISLWNNRKIQTLKQINYLEINLFESNNFSISKKSEDTLIKQSETQKLVQWVCPHISITNFILFVERAL